MKYIEENEVIVEDDGIALTLTVPNCEPFASWIPMNDMAGNVALRGLLVRLQHQIENIEHDTDETHDVYDATATIIRYLENHR